MEHLAERPVMDINQAAKPPAAMSMADVPGSAMSNFFSLT
jgi:hypothetical protein